MNRPDPALTEPAMTLFDWLLPMLAELSDIAVLKLSKMFKTATKTKSF